MYRLSSIQKSILIDLNLLSIMFCCIELLFMAMAKGLMAVNWMIYLWIDVVRID